MKRLLIAFILGTVLFIPLVLAEPLEISIHPQSQTVQPNTTAVYRLEVKNNQPVLDTFYITYRGDYLSFLMPGKPLLKVGPGATASTDISFYPKAEGTYTYKVTLESQSNSSLSATADLILDVVVPRAVQVTAFDVDKRGAELEIFLELNSQEKEQTEILILLKNAAGQPVREISYTEDVFGRETLVKNVSLADIPPGKYSIEVLVEGKVFSQDFSIPAIHDVSQHIDKVVSPLYEEVTVTVTNKGNVVEYDYKVIQKIPQGDFITGFVTAPEVCHEGGGVTTCQFNIPQIGPGETKTVVYRFEFWPSYAKVAAAVIVLVFLGLLYLLHFTKPKIKKRFSRKSGDVCSVILEIKGPPLKKLKNVVVRDWVSPLAKVLQEEFTHLRPVLRKSDAGTELIWRLGDIAAREERIISYRIKSLVEGHLKMPRACMRYRDTKDNRIRVYSRPLLIK